MDSAVRPEDLQGPPVGLWPCHQQGGNQVLFRLPQLPQKFNFNPWCTKKVVDKLQNSHSIIHNLLFRLKDSLYGGIEMKNNSTRITLLFILEN